MASELAVQQQHTEVTPMSLIERASAQGATIEQMQQLFELKLRVDADNAKRSFNEAFTAFKAETIRIVRDKENTQYSKAATPTSPARPAMYTSLENMVSTVTPFLSKHGLSHNWEIAQDKDIRVTCILTHTLGHSKSVSLSAPPDTSGAKNALQQVKSSVTYLKVSTFESVCGLASAFGSLNDDGNGAGTPNPKDMHPDEVERYIGLIENARTADTLKQMYEAGMADAATDTSAQRQFIAAKKKRKAELGL